MARTWWNRQIGGAPFWLVTITPVLLVALLAGTAVLRQQRQAPEDDYIPRPVPTFFEAMPLAVFIGDSYSAGQGASKLSARWTTLAAHELGWEEVNKARGGTGYATASGRAGCGRDYCPPYPEVLADPFDRIPDIVVVSGGRNDSGDLDAFRAGVEATLSAVRSVWPKAELVVTNPLWDDDPVPTSIVSKHAIVQEVAAAYEALFLDLGQPLLGRPDFLVGDGVHPNDNGHQTIAGAFVAAYRTAHPTTPASAPETSG